MYKNIYFEPHSEEKSLSIPGALMLSYVVLSILCSVMKLVIFSASFEFDFWRVFLLGGAAFLGVMLIIGVNGPYMVIAAAPAAASFILNIGSDLPASALAAAGQALIILYIIFFHGGAMSPKINTIRKLWWIPALVFTAGQLYSFAGINLRFYTIPYIAAALILSGAYFMMLFEISRGEVFVAPKPEPYYGSFEQEKTVRPEDSWQSNASWNHGTQYNADGSSRNQPDAGSQPAPGPRAFYQNQPGPMPFYQGGDYAVRQNNAFKETPMPSSGEYIPIGKNAVEDLRLYKQLLDEGILTQEEFDAKKRQILNM